MAQQPQLSDRDKAHYAALNGLSHTPIAGFLPGMFFAGKAAIDRDEALASASVRPSMVIPAVGGVGAGVNPPAYVQTFGNTGHHLGVEPLAQPMMVGINNKLIRPQNLQLNPALTQTVETQAAAPVTYAGGRSVYAMPEQTATQPSAVSGQYMGGNTYVPLHSTTNVMPRTPTFGRDALDIPDANRAVARQYADIVAAGGTPVLNEWDAMHLNRLRAQGSLAASAATKAADVNDMYRAMNDPDTRNRAQQIASTQGVSFQTAMQMAIAGTLAQQGDYALANQYELRNTLPAMEAEQQQRIALGIASGTDTPAMADYMGNTFQSATAPTSVYGTDDGNVRLNTPSHSVVTPTDDAFGAAALTGSTAPVRDGYANTQWLQQSRAANAIGAQQAAAKQADQIIKSQIAQRAGYEKMATQAARLQEAQYKAAAAAEQRRTGRSPTAPQAKPANEVEYLRALISSAQLMPRDDPNRARVAATILKKYGINIDAAE